jgi:PE family
VALVAAADAEVSVGVAHLFSAQAQQFQGLAGKAAAFHDQFVQTLKTSADSYSATETAAVASLQPAAASLAPPAGPLEPSVSTVGRPRTDPRRSVCPRLHRLRRDLHRGAQLAGESGSVAYAVRFLRSFPERLESMAGSDYRDCYRDMAKTLGFEGHIAWAEAMP